MRKFTALITLLMLVALMAGCGANPSNPSEPAAAANASDNSFDFSLPEGYEIAGVSDTACSILRNGEEVGGIVLTGLDPAVIKKTGGETEDMSLSKYLDSCAQPPLGAEYIAMQVDGHLEISFQTTNFDTGESHRYLRTLFEKNSQCYDLWVDGAIEDHEAIAASLRDACIG